MFNFAQKQNFLVTLVAQWLRRLALYMKVAGSNPAINRVFFFFFFFPRIRCLKFTTHKFSLHTLVAKWLRSTRFCEKKKLEYDTKGSRVITDLSTDLACECLTSVIGREQVFSLKCGRTQ